ncbi:unnamed protein product [Rangifer tarandus platyrhynchus]|uniref:Uncharacterized protein n=1 Tax=Rangifer tarandus platyrhynchus TaxID=3082113 RepID=A0ABN8Z6C7_RANTA|nr:unnamed protein product [Rangifer tarandus platyrhynchus]
MPAGWGPGREQPPLAPRDRRLGPGGPESSFGGELAPPGWRATSALGAPKVAGRGAPPTRPAALLCRRLGVSLLRYEPGTVAATA